MKEMEERYFQLWHSRHWQTSVMANSYNQRQQYLLLTLLLFIHLLTPQHQSKQKECHYQIQFSSRKVNLILSFIHQMELSIFKLEWRNIQLSSIVLSSSFPLKHHEERHNNSNLGRSTVLLKINFFTWQFHTRSVSKGTLTQANFFQRRQIYSLGSNTAWTNQLKRRYMLKWTNSITLIINNEWRERSKIYIVNYRVIANYPIREKNIHKSYLLQCEENPMRGSPWWTTQNSQQVHNLR